MGFDDRFVGTRISALGGQGRSDESMGVGTGQAFPRRRRSHSPREQDGAGGLGDVEARDRL